MAGSVGCGLGSQRPPPLALHRSDARRSGYASSSPYERSGSAGMGSTPGYGRLDVRTSGVRRGRGDARVREGPRGDADSGEMLALVGGEDGSEGAGDAVAEVRGGVLKREMGDERRDVGWRGLMGKDGVGERTSWIWSKQSSQTRAGRTGESGESNAVSGVPCGGWRKPS